MAEPAQRSESPVIVGTERGTEEPPHRPVPDAPAPPSPRKRRKRHPAAGAETAIWDGLIAAPTRPETRLRDSLLYPLWGATGVALLVLMTPILCLSSVMFFEGVRTLIEGGGSPAGGSAGSGSSLSLRRFLRV